MLLLAAAIAIRRTPWPAHGPDSVLLYAEDEAGLKLGHAAVEVSGIRCGAKLSLKVSPSPKPNPNPNPNPTRCAGYTAAQSRAYPRPCSARCSPRYSSTRTTAAAAWLVS